jgi:peptidoglycan/LPS O-acetylase OafA/YrhL
VVSNPPAAAVRHIPSLDGLRAFSFLLVFVAHIGLEEVVPGGFGVTVFFFLSGFLITTLLRSEYDRNHSLNFGHFWLRRALRILPPFYLVLMAAIGSGLLIDPPGTLSPYAIGAQLLHVTNYWIIYHGNVGLPLRSGTGVYWSLAVEEHFYLLFPFLYLGMRRANLTGARQAVVLATLCLLVLAWRYVLVTVFHVSTDRTYMGSDSRVDSILFGCALAVWGNPVLDSRPLNERRWKFLYTPLAVALIAASLLYRAPAFRETARYSLQGLALAPLFIAAVRFPGWLPFRLLNWRPLAFIGMLSYSLYLVHYASIFFVQQHLGGGVLVQGVAAFALSFAIAWLMYIAIERPCARLRRRLMD